MNKKMSDNWIFRWIYYVLGLIILSLGITLNTKTLLGVSAISSLPYVFSKIGDFSFGNATLAIYIIMVAAQFVIKGKDRNLIDLLQIPLSIVFTRFINIYDYILKFENISLGKRIALLMLATAFIGIGSAMTVNMKLVANPGDAVVSAIADKVGYSMGLTKNIFDVICVCVSAALGVIFLNTPVGIGAGTIVLAIGVGRVISLFNKLFKEKMESQAGLFTLNNIEYKNREDVFE
ncbi:Uncharacterized membrane protein YczE [Clostridium sp. DSM 8431]|uniref:YczE/YyaS/YitT family protein n=1 Tax=Clostridium sp. DSM 8431 TaxID=1761781 RepID=UPI0008EC228A|nr:DUF6198 family protein [Clostridium sp. DSM 8431]SFU66562.1 Uncharacterized membrane protein YczE [Clostridium sp. DSM 8431]